MSVWTVRQKKKMAVVERKPLVEARLYLIEITAGIFEIDIWTKLGSYQKAVPLRPAISLTVKLLL